METSNTPKWLFWNQVGEEIDEIIQYIEFFARVCWDSLKESSKNVPTINREELKSGSIFNDLNRKVCGLGKEEKIMNELIKVSCRGFAGELVHLDRKDACGVFNLEKNRCETYAAYDISIKDKEKQVTHTFTGVKPSEIKFLGGEVSFG